MSNVWLRLMWRVVWWGAVLGAAWAAMLVLLDGGAVGILRLHDPNYFAESDDGLGPANYWQLAVFVGIVLVLWFAPRGILTGALCGFYAPASRSFNPFRFRFVRRVALEVVLLSIPSFFGAALTAWVSARGLEAVHFQGDAFLLGICAFLLLDACGFGIALWRALNRASRAEKLA